MIDYVLHLGGRGGSGKTTLLNALNTKLGLEKTKTCTTRLPRFEGETGYFFISEEDFFQNIKSGNIIECYFRNSNKAFYGTRAPTQTGIFQTEIRGLVALRKWCFQHAVPFLSVYLDVKTGTLLTRLQKRADINEIPENRLAEDAYYEHFKTWSDIIYDYNDVSVDEGVENVVAMLSQRLGLDL